MKATRFATNLYIKLQKLTLIEMANEITTNETNEKFGLLEDKKRKFDFSCCLSNICEDISKYLFRLAAVAALALAIFALLLAKRYVLTRTLIVAVKSYHLVTRLMRPTDSQV